jgi:dihydrofolate reductase
MKRLILQMQMSVDGFVSADDHNLDWTLWDWGSHCPWDEPLKQRFNETIAGIDTVLLSGPMADGYINHWTGMSEQRGTDPDYAFTHRIVAAHKRVLSQSLESIRWPRASIGRGPLIEEVVALKQGKGGDIICFGGVSFAASLLEGNVVDELQLYVNPMAISAGRSIFRHARRLHCIDATSYECGIAVLRYEAAPKSLRSSRRDTA